MFEDFNKETPNQQHWHNEVVANSKIATMQEIAPNFGVTIQILAKEGERYSYQSIDASGKLITFADRVPKGNSYIGISGQSSGMGSFWDAVEAKENAKQPLANPPKI